MAIDREKIGKIADFVRATLSLSVPITLEQLLAAIERLGGNCVAKSLDEMRVEAEISTPSQTNAEYRFEINYLVGRPEKRILFSIAHELGHLFLHLLEPNGNLSPAETLQRSMDVTQKELEANEFAAALLMPEEAFVIKCRDIVVDNRVDVSQIAEFFNVSVQAATVRGNVIGLWQ